MDATKNMFTELAELPATTDTDIVEGATVMCKGVVIIVCSCCL